MKRILLPFLFSLICLISQTTAIAQSSLEIIDPRQGWWGSYGGEISEATLAVEPQGLYMKYDLYMTFAITDQLSASDSMEVEFLFTLPKEAIVCDSWLWIANYISYGIIMDADSANKIYEDIVDRRTDPSILYKRSATEYELRIFPITTLEPRKVKITFLLPMEWTDKQVLAPLPLRNIPPWINSPVMDLIVKDTSAWPNPKILESPNITFTSHTNSEHGSHLKAQIGTSLQNFNNTIAFDSPMNNGVYVSHYPTETNEGYYEMALLPSEHLDSLPETKMLVLVDYFGSNGNDIRPQIKRILKDQLSPRDSFNLMLNVGGNIVSASPTWLPADLQLIDSLFNPSTFNLATNSNLSNLLKNGLQFMTDHNNEGSILLFSDNDWYVTSQSGENFYNDLTGDSSISVPIHIANYQHKDIPVTWDPQLRRSFTGNEYLFGILASRSGGSYQDVKNPFGSFYLTLLEQVIGAKGKFELIDLYTKLASGFCYDRHSFNYSNNAQSLYGVMFQTGRYYGDFPLNVDFFSIYQEEFQFFDINIAQSEMASGNHIPKVWAAKQIQFKDQLAVSPSIRKDIIDLSIESHVLSTRTAFLCLEDTIARGLLVYEEQVWVGLDPLEEENTLQLEAFPNPIKDIVTIQIEHLPELPLNSFELEIFDVQGRIIHTFYLTDYQLVEGSISFEWNAEDLPVGMYLLMLKGDVKPRVIRLVKK